MGVDLFGPHIWVTFGLALLLLTPIQNVLARSWAFAALNIAFIIWIGAWKQAALVLLGLCSVYGVLRLIQSGRTRAAALWLCSAAVLSLWLLHKLPWLSHKVAHGNLSPLLAAVGFSYIALRLVEVIRAVAEGAPAPGFAYTVNYLVPFHMLAAGPIQ